MSAGLAQILPWRPAMSAYLPSLRRRALKQLPIADRRLEEFDKNQIAQNEKL